MQKLYNCNIVEENVSCDHNEIKKKINEYYKRLKEQNNSEDNIYEALDSSNSSSLSDEEENNILDYTKLYKKFKEKNKCVNIYNKNPIHAYKYPPLIKIDEFNDLKKEYIEEEKKKKLKIEKTYNDETDHYYDTDLKIYCNDLYKQKKSLRQRIYDGEVMFYDDYIEKQAVEDYERFFHKPYKFKRKDEMGKYYFFGKKLEMTKEEDLYRKYYNLDDLYFINKLKQKEEEEKRNEEARKKEIEKKKKEKIDNKRKKKIEKAKKEYENLNNQAKSLILKLQQENNSKNMNIYQFYKKNKNIIFDKNLSELSKKELLNGHIPDIIPITYVRKMKHPQQNTITFNRLQNYATNLKDLTRCLYLQNEMDGELMKNWKHPENKSFELLRKTRIKNNYKKDIYVVTKEGIEKSKEKLKNLLEKDAKEQEENEKSSKAMFNVEFKKKERDNKIVSGGRYNI